MVYKLDPYTPEASGFDENDADWLVKQGFDSVRLGFIWKAVEPEPGVYDDEYIESVRQTTRMLTDRGIMVLLDAHHDQYNEAFQGEFAPDWAVITDEVPSTLPLGFPANQVGNIGLLRALDNFLANRKNLTGCQYWAYCGCDDPTTHNQKQQGIVADPKVPGPVSDRATEPHQVAILAAPHARAIAGTPTETTWDHNSRTYTASWNTTRVDGSGKFGAGAITEVAVPKINFPGGYEVEVTGGEVVSEPGAERLFIASDGSDEVKMTLTPVGERLPGTEPTARGPAWRRVRRAGLLRPRFH